MNDLAIPVFYTLIVIVIICIILKVWFWVTSKGKGAIRFIKSFFKIYTTNRIYNASENWRRYLKASNTINVILWVAVLLCAIVYFKYDVA